MRRFWLPAVAVGAILVTTGTVGADIPATTPSAFQQPSIERTAGLGAQSVVAVDLNQDGFLDLVVADNLSEDVSVLFGSAAGVVPDQPLVIPALSFPAAAQVADTNGDGLLDIVVIDDFDNQMGVLLQSPGDPLPTFTLQQATDTGDGPEGVALADFDGDGQVDAATANYYAGTVSFFHGRGDGTFSLPVDVYSATNFDPMALVTVDLNADHKADLIVANYDSDNVVVLMGKGDGTFMESQSLTVGLGPFAVALADLNIDGHLDLVTSNDVDSTVATFIGHGDGTFDTTGSVVTFDAGAFPQGVAIWDFNLDGRPDIAVANTFVAPDQPAGEGVTVIRGNGDGTFQPVVAGDSFLVGGFTPYAVASGDLNGDHKREIATANVDADETTALSILVNEGNLLPGDTNGDGVVDAADLTQGIGELFDVGSPSVITVAGGFEKSGPGVDANGDERVTAADLLAIANLVVGS